MAKHSVTYVGTPDDDTKTIEVFGHTFEKGKAVQIDEEDPNYAKIAGNPTFEVKKG